jgi:hypothetical protein
MAYVSQDLKAKIAPRVKSILKKHGIKGTLAVRNHMTLVLNISRGKIDFIKNSNDTCAADPYQVANGVQPSRDYIDVNQFHYDKHFSGAALECVDALMQAMNEGNWDKSDSQSDYFNVGWYVDINIGNWNKPYQVSVN